MQEHIDGFQTAGHRSLVEKIPETHCDLIDGHFVALTTLMPDGQRQITPVWCNRKDDCILINIMKGFRREKNMRANPKVAVLVIDPKNSSRWIQVRGRVVELTTEGAEAHADKLTRRYCPGKEHFYRDIYPVEQKQKETRVIARIAPIKISLDAIFG